MTELRRRSLVLPTLSLSLFAVYALWLSWQALSPGEPPPLIANALHDAAVLGAAALGWSGWRRAPTTLRAGLLLLALALTARLAADLTWSVLELRGGAVPYPSVAEAFYLLVYPLLGAALLRLAPLPPRPLQRLRLTLDSLIAVGGLATLLWWTGLHRYLGDVLATSTSLEAALAVWYPLVSLSLLVLLLVVVLQGRRLPTPLLTLGLGIAATVGANLTFVWLNAAGGYRTGHPVDGLFALAALLWAVGAWLAAEGRGEHAFDHIRVPPPVQRAFAALPYAVVSGLSVLLLWLPGTADLQGRGVLVGVVLTMLLMVARQGVAFHDNQQLTRRLRRSNRELEHTNAELERSRRQLGHQARHDALTGLPNRLHFEEELRRALRPGAFGQLEPFAVMFLDLDGFKEVNDTFGHAAGDDLLVHVAARLRANLRDSDLVARQGGDEFLVLLRPASTAEALASGRRLLDSLTQAVTVRGHRLHITASIGVSLFPLHSRDAAELSRRADLAMYQAKDRGKNTLQVHGEGQPDLGDGTQVHPTA